MTDHDEDFEEDVGPAAHSIGWDIRREGRAWAGKETYERMDLRPEKLEIWEGKLLFEENERLLLLGLLLENVGADATVRLGDPQVWRDAVAALPAQA